ncbi:DUF4184 family protein [Paenibacillus solisilvae]|uniref:DUF4184 family protein n=1 Tax=Paenibacillus solisilvae TaxID=2486751 RepID=A0ABW0VSZ8_9BACL
MPFTFSHPLYSVPLYRAAPKWLSVTGLLLGSMAPDLEYFAAMESYRTIGHSLTGFFVLGLPLCIGLAFAFHFVVKPVLPQFIPSIWGLDRFVQSMTRARWEINSPKAWVGFLISLFIGFLTHMFMDGWTHRSGTFVNEFPLLKEEYGGEGIYQWMQYGFSLLGLIVPALLLLARFKKWRQENRIEQRPEQRAVPHVKALLWLCAVGMGVLLFLFKYYFSYDRLWLGIFIVAPLTAALFGLYLSSLLYMSIQRGRLVLGAAFLVMYWFLILLYKTAERTAGWSSETAIWLGYLLLLSILLLTASRICGKD